MTLLLEHDSSSAVVAYAQRGWTWAPHAKRVRYRVAAVGGECATDAQREVVRSLEAWEPLLPKGHAPAAGAGSGGWALMIADDVELSEGFYLYIRHALAAVGGLGQPFAKRDAGGAGSAGGAGGGGNGGGHELLGFALGAPAGKPVGGVAASAGRLQRAASCGTVYAAAAWAELRTFAGGMQLGCADGNATSDSTARRLEAAAHSSAGHATTHGAWSTLLERFMAERGYALHFSGLNLCRRRGDGKTRLASGAEVAALLTGGVHLDAAAVADWQVAADRRAHETQPNRF